MSLDGILEKIVKADINPHIIEGKGIFVDAKDLLFVIKTVKNELPFSFLDLLTCSDLHEENQLMMTYVLCSCETDERFWIRVRLDRQNPVIASLFSEFSGADWLEREVFDLYGVYFENHPDLRRILTPDDFSGHGLRKDYSRPGFFCKKPVKISGMKV